MLFPDVKAKKMRNAVKYIAFIVCCVVFLACGQVEAFTSRARSLCPHKVFGTFKVKGRYQGMDHTSSVIIGLSDGGVLKLFSDDSTHQFSRRGWDAGKRVLVTYNVEQLWEETNNDCMVTEVLKDSEFLDEKKPQSAALRALCPDKVLDTGKVEGKFVGVSEGGDDGPHGSIELPDGVFYFGVKEKSMNFIEKTFQEGQKISITYELKQIWDSGNNECWRPNVFVSGKVLK